MAKTTYGSAPARRRLAYRGLKVPKTEYDPMRYGKSPDKGYVYSQNPTSYSRPQEIGDQFHRSKSREQNAQKHAKWLEANRQRVEEKRIREKKENENLATNPKMRGGRLMYGAKRTAQEDTDIQQGLRGIGMYDDQGNIDPAKQKELEAKLGRKLRTREIEGMQKPTGTEIDTGTGGKYKVEEKLPQGQISTSNYGEEGQKILKDAGFTSLPSDRSQDTPEQARARAKATGKVRTDLNVQEARNTADEIEHGYVPEHMRPVPGMTPPGQETITGQRKMPGLNQITEAQKGLTKEIRDKETELYGATKGQRGMDTPGVDTYSPVLDAPPTPGGGHGTPTRSLRDRGKLLLKTGAKIREGMQGRMDRLQNLETAALTPGRIPSGVSQEEFESMRPDSPHMSEQEKDEAARMKIEGKMGRKLTLNDYDDEVLTPEDRSDMKDIAEGRIRSQERYRPLPSKFDLDLKKRNEAEFQEARKELEAEEAAKPQPQTEPEAPAGPDGKADPNAPVPEPSPVTKERLEINKQGMEIINPSDPDADEAKPDADEAVVVKLNGLAAQAVRGDRDAFNAMVKLAGQYNSKSVKRVSFLEESIRKGAPKTQEEEWQEKDAYEAKVEAEAKQKEVQKDSAQFKSWVKDSDVAAKVEEARKFAEANGDKVSLDAINQIQSFLKQIEKYPSRSKELGKQVIDGFYDLATIKQAQDAKRAAEAKRVADEKLAAEKLAKTEEKEKAAAAKTEEKEKAAAAKTRQTEELDKLTRGHDLRKGRLTSELSEKEKEIKRTEAKATLIGAEWKDAEAEVKELKKESAKSSKQSRRDEIKAEIDEIRKRQYVAKRGGKPIPKGEEGYDEGRVESRANEIRAKLEKLESERQDIIRRSGEEDTKHGEDIEKVYGYGEEAAGQELLPKGEPQDSIYDAQGKQTKPYQIVRPQMDPNQGLGGLQPGLGGLQPGLDDTEVDRRINKNVGRQSMLGENPINEMFTTEEIKQLTPQQIKKISESLGI